MKPLVISAVIAIPLLAAVIFRREIIQAAHQSSIILCGESTIASRLAECGAAARTRMQPHFEQAGIDYPPARVLMVGLKQDRRLELYAAKEDKQWRLIKSYPVMGASGTLGPKLREGDLQVPEGFYRIESLNPNSRFHLSLRLNYPNEFDRARAAEEGRTNLGGDIMIHGGSASVGCLAMGDPAIEELFVLAADAGPDSVEVVLSPVDFRKQGQAALNPQSAWLDWLYQHLEAKLKEALGS